MEILILAISLFASVIGAVCGIGGGVIIKPVLDAANIAGVAEISFLSGCTVLSMSLYSVAKALHARESLVDFQMGTPLAIGAAAGGIAGKWLFSAVRSMVAQAEHVGGYQATCLLVLTLFTLLYTLNQKRIRTHAIKHKALCVLVGVLLGISSSFLGIGGGPINLVVLYFLFSMSPKVAAQNSLYIILVSQCTSLLTTVVTGSVPQINWVWLALMVAGGVVGGIVGRKVNKCMADTHVAKLFIVLNAVIILISGYNAYTFFSIPAV